MKFNFYKDGYTDLNGKFNYLALNIEQLKILKNIKFLFLKKIKEQLLKNVIGLKT